MPSALPVSVSHLLRSLWFQIWSGWQVKPKHIVLSDNVVGRRAGHGPSYLLPTITQQLQPTIKMSPKTADSSAHKEGRILLAVKAYQIGQISSVWAAAEIYGVPRSTLADRVRCHTAHVDTAPNSQKLTTTEESSLIKWILDMDQQGLPPCQGAVHNMANLILSNWKGASSTVSKRWVTRFIGCHKELWSKYNCEYDDQQAQCEDPKIIKEWFQLVHNTIQKYGILEQNIYNFNETGFQMSVASTAKVVTDSYHTTSCVRALQPGNQE